ncbi:hypothetical protein [Parahaliea aestuarii]|uniref:Uncharacterized protein n=1 Tax=Parahaliea aestuarii TaxID=1852021 RepID=A0A5C8ZSW8_9GAMM|nr:hypothetical protein [Parahaliea aestuarii]TXS91608.1 hypothetical protein FVW59_10600 [Parahaliea aestuarii]
MRLSFLSFLCLLFLALTACSDSSDRREIPPEPEPQIDYQPIVFVHGQSGSAQQFESQAQRFTSNGYPQDLIFAFEYDTSQEDNPLADLDTFIDSVLSETGADTVYAVGHSRGTSVWTSYLDAPDFGGPDKVSKYVNIDGRAPDELPGGVPTIGIWGEWNTADSGFNLNDNMNSQIGPNPEDNFYFPEKSHTEVATSPEAFGLMYEFFTEVAAETTDVLPGDGDTREVAGRAVLFPENIGFQGARLEVWPVEQATGQRAVDEPVARADIGASGEFGPLTLEAGQHYEFALLRPPSESFDQPSVHHFYPEPFVSDDYLFRLQSSQAGQSIESFLPTADDTTGMVVARQREFWGDQGAGSDELFVDGVNVLLPSISPRAVGNGTGVNLAVFVFDHEGDKVSDLEKGEVFPFSALTFLTGLDLYIPATATATGTVTVSLVDRGGETTELNVPNWPSSSNRISVMFDDVPK